MALAVLAIAGGVVWWSASSASGPDPGARHAATRFAQAWTSGRWGQVGYVDTTAANVAASVGQTTAALDGAPASVALRSIDTKGAGATARLAVTWNLAGWTPWRYESKVPLVRRDGRWRVRWSPAVLYPGLRAGERLTMQRAQPPRATILDGNGHPLVVPMPVVHVGVEPARVTDVGTLTAQLAALVGIDPVGLRGRIQAATPHAFVDVITLRESDYDRLKAQLQPIPGVVFQRSTEPLAPTTKFARAVLGTIGQATAQRIQASGGRLGPDDLTGLSGLQLHYDDQLAGRDGVTVQIAPGSNKAARTVFTMPPRPGRALQVTLDPRVQEAADSVLAGATKRTALVAIQPSTGKVLAVSDGGPGPDDSSYPLALLGQYAPGSSFKVVTTYALLGKGLTLDTPVDCPATATIGGRVFHNAESEVLGSVPFHRDFAESCNTAFVGLSPQVSGTALPDAAHALGLGIPRNLGTPVPTASVPVPGDAADLAAEAFGQGRLAVTPLDMAGVAASVAAGASHPLQLVLNTTPAPGAARPLPTAIVTSLQQLMREVVTAGTGTAAAGVPGAPVAGKTGTAEYGTTEPLHAHAWFIGYQGDIAFSVFVEDGGFGGDAAAPLAARFLTALAGRG